MNGSLIHPPKARRGDQIAVVSPSFAAAGAFPAIHEQAMRRLTDITGLVPPGHGCSSTFALFGTSVVNIADDLLGQTFLIA